MRISCAYMYMCICDVVVGLNILVHIHITYGMNGGVVIYNTDTLIYITHDRNYVTTYHRSEL